jgi:hypothetical protein
MNNPGPAFSVDGAQGSKFLGNSPHQGRPTTNRPLTAPHKIFASFLVFGSLSRNQPVENREWTRINANKRESWLKLCPCFPVTFWWMAQAAFSGLVLIRVHSRFNKMIWYLAISVR